MFEVFRYNFLIGCPLCNQNHAFSTLFLYYLGSCRYAQCTLGSWSSWADTSSPVSASHCASQRRTRSYSLTWLYLERQDNCNGVSPQSCPSAQEETREKSKGTLFLVLGQPIFKPTNPSNLINVYP